MHEILAHEAALDGISASQFVREALLMRCMWRRGRRDEPVLPSDDARTVRRVLEQLRPMLDQLEVNEQ
jgi:hypothetical protein